MSTDLAEAPEAPQPHPVATHLKKCGIDEVLLIDDAFDPFDVRTLQDEVEELWDGIVRSDEMKDELVALGLEIGDASDITDNVLEHLFAKRDTLTSLRERCDESVFRERLSKMADLDPLREHFHQLGIPTVSCGSDQELPDKSFKLVFLDYSLGPDATAGSIGNSRRRADDIYQSTAEDAEKPFIVLMSSRPDAEAAKDDFRKQSKLLGGLFAFLKKEEFKKRDQFNLHLATWALGMPTRHAIQRFVEALDRSSVEAQKEFSDIVRGLGAGDYANIQFLSLRPDGHPLGDYMLWLYKSLFSHLLHDNPKVIAEQKKLDALLFTEFTPSQAVPSVDLAQIYRFALTEPGVEALGPHPRAAEGNTDPHLQLGDMFFKPGDGKEVLVVLSAACDLAFAPGAARLFPHDQFVLFEYGELQPITEAPRDAAATTELFLFDDTVYRILWDHRKAVWKEYGNVTAWLQGSGFTRQTRLSLPYALELQRSYASHFTRIGMPVKPPMIMRADVEVIGQDGTGKCTRLATIEGGAQVVRILDDDKKQDEEFFVLTVDCVGSVVSSLQQVVDRISAADATLEEGIAEIRKAAGADIEKELRPLHGKREGLKGERAKVTSLMQAYDQWLPMVRKLQKLPAVGKRHDIDPRLLCVFRNAAESFAGAYPKAPPIVLHIVTAYGIASAAVEVEIPAAAELANEQDATAEGVAHE